MSRMKVISAAAQVTGVLHSSCFDALLDVFGL